MSLFAGSKRRSIAANIADKNNNNHKTFRRSIVNILRVRHSGGSGATSTPQRFGSKEIDDPLTYQEWAVAIVIAYETGAGLTSKAQGELALMLRDKNFKDTLRKELVDSGYGKIFGLQ
jgi:hypothetical protein